MWRMALGVCCLALTLVGCSSNLKQVIANVDAVRIDSTSDEGVRVLVTVTAENPNEVALPIVRAEYKVALNGAQPFEFTDLPKATLPALGTQTLTFPAAFALNGKHEQHTYQVEGRLIYEPPGEIRKLLTEYGVPLPSASFSDEGTLP
ncbi:MAG: hypothetical protein Kow00105_13000 [Phycisphaeraceae bacterium]